VSPSQPLPARRQRTLVALAGTLSIGSLALVPATAMAAQGDNEVVIDLIQQVTPAVVTIQTPGDAFPSFQGTLPEGFQLPDGPQLPEDFQVPGDPQTPGDSEVPGDSQTPTLPQDFQIGGSGSGVIVSPDGLILTNRHVVGNADQVRVILDDGTVLDGKVTGVDTLTDFAFVDVEAQDLPTVTLGDSSAIKVGQMAVSLGNPLGQFPSSAAVGIISGLDRSLDISGGNSRLQHLIQTDAAVNSGNSGGALFDGDGNLIGITTAQAGMADGIGFALPIDLAKPIIEQAETGETITRPYIGVVYQELDAEVAKEQSLPVTNGAWIGGNLGGEDPVVAGSPADEAGLQAGDIITAVDGTQVDGDNPLDLQVLRFAPGDQIQLDVLRDGQSLQLEATLGTRPADLTA
jgi:serine protease Do